MEKLTREDCDIIYRALYWYRKNGMGGKKINTDNFPDPDKQLKHLCALFMMGKDDIMSMQTKADKIDEILPILQSLFKVKVEI